MNKPCIRCGERPRSDYAPYCRQCRSEYMKAYRRDRSIEGFGDIDARYAKTVLPDRRYTCPYCGNWRDMDGDEYKSQAEANECCEHGETHTTPVLAEDRPNERGYGEERYRLGLGGRVADRNHENHTRIIPTMNTARLFGKALGGD